MRVSVLLTRFIALVALGALTLVACTSPGPVSEPTPAPEPTATSPPAASPTPVPATVTATNTPLPPTPAPTNTPRPATSTPTRERPTVTRVQLFFVALDDGGQSGQAIGCNDSLVAVEREIEPTVAPLRAALEALFSVGEFYGQSGLYNAVHQSDLQVEGIAIADGRATIQLSGTVRLGGACDNPRFAAQLRQTALQFPTVDEAAIFIDGQSLEEVLSLR